MPHPPDIPSVWHPRSSVFGLFRMRVVLRGSSAKAVEHLDRGDGGTRVVSRENGGYVRIAITDDGPGIFAKHREHFSGPTALKSRDHSEDFGLASRKRERLSNALADRSGLQRHRPHEAAWLRSTDR